MLTANAATHIPAAAATAATLRNREHLTNHKRKTLTPGLNLTIWIRQFVAPTNKPPLLGFLVKRLRSLRHDNWDPNEPPFSALPLPRCHELASPQLDALAARFFAYRGLRIRCTPLSPILAQQSQHNPSTAMVQALLYTLRACDRAQRRCSEPDHVAHLNVEVSELATVSSRRRRRGIVPLWHRRSFQRSRRSRPHIECMSA